MQSKSRYYSLESDGIDEEEHIRTTRINHLGICRMLFGTRLRAKSHREGSRIDIRDRHLQVLEGGIACRVS